MQPTTQSRHSKGTNLSRAWVAVLFTLGVGLNLFLAAWAAAWLLSS